MKRLSLLIALLLSSSVLAQRLPEPPRPDPRNPVDYAKWVNEQMSRGVSSNAADLYDTLERAALLAQNLVNEVERVSNLLGCGRAALDASRGVVRCRMPGNEYQAGRPCRAAKRSN